jgi:hypothetical protein
LIEQIWGVVGVEDDRVTKTKRKKSHAQKQAFARVHAHLRNHAYLRDRDPKIEPLWFNATVKGFLKYVASWMKKKLAVADDAMIPGRHHYYHAFVWPERIQDYIRQEHKTSFRNLLIQI